MIIDHRTYTTHPGQLANFVKVYAETGYAIQQRYLGECRGWYLSMDVGELNQVVHLWAYDSVADRAARREKMNADKEWQDYLVGAMPFIQKMENKLLTEAPFFADAQKS